jgi:hypothetical protein
MPHHTLEVDIHQDQDSVVDSDMEVAQDINKLLLDIKEQKD